MRVADRVLETSTSTGTGDFTLGGAVSGFNTFASKCTVGDRVPYAIEAVDANGVPTGANETGIGTYSAANTLTRTTVLSSSNAGALVSFAAGIKRVGLVPIACNTSNWVNVRAFGAKGDGATDDTTAIQAALDHANAMGGGVCYLPTGNYKITTYLTVSPNTLVTGDGPAASTITSAHVGGSGANAMENLRNGSIIRTAAAINSSTQVFISIRDITLKNTEIGRAHV